MYEIIDEYCIEKDKKVITFDYHGIQGLKNFCYWHLGQAALPIPMHYHSQIIEFHCLVKGKRFCEVACLSLSHFKVKFKEAIGMTPAEYMTLKKVEYAKSKLQHSTIPVTELAFTLGFSSSNYFCTVFKKYVNLTPSEYRNQFISPE